MTHEQVLTELMTRGILPGSYVKWTTVIGTTRYGCVLEILSQRLGYVLIQASNGRLQIEGSILEPAPEVDDVIVADLEQTYGPKSTWKLSG